MRRRAALAGAAADVIHRIDMQAAGTHLLMSERIRRLVGLSGIGWERSNTDSTVRCANRATALSSRRV